MLILYLQCSLMYNYVETHYKLIQLHMPEVKKETILKARKEIGLFFKQKREEKELTKAEITRRTGLTREQIGKMESGEWNYTIGSYIAYAISLGFNIHMK